MSTANSLLTVERAAVKVAANLNDLSNEHPHTLKKITAAGKASFRFTTVVEVNGEKCEVTIKNYGI